MKSKIFIILALALLFFPLASAENIGTFKQGETINLTNFCKEGGCTGITMVSVQYPDGTIDVIDTAMTFVGQQGFYEFSDTSQTGTYYFKTMGSNDVTDTDSFDITASGVGIETKDSLIYLVILLVSIFLFLVSSYGFLKIPYKNKRNEDGQIIGINDLKYLKIILFFITYGLLTWIMNLMIGISNNFFSLGISNKLFEVLFKVMISLVYPLLIFTVIWIVIAYVTDLKIGKLIDRGFKV